jgi:hypothetical protein
MCGNGAALGAIVGGIAAYMTGGASLGLTAGTATAAAAGAGMGAMAGSTLVDQPEAMKKGTEAQSQANKIAVDQATKQADLADQANNRANGKQPDIAGMMSQNQLNAKGGQSGTMLTGNAGVDPNSLLLGKKTLLGT